MLENKKTMDNKYPESYKFVGKDNCGYDSYLVNTRENNAPKKIINLRFNKIVYILANSALFLSKNDANYMQLHYITGTQIAIS